MSRTDREDEVSFELRQAARPGEASGMAWLGGAEATPSGALPAWCKVEIPDDPRVGAGPAPESRRRSVQPTTIVRRAEMDRTAQAAPITTSALDAQLLRKMSKIPIIYGLSAKLTLPRPALQFKVEHDLPKNTKLVEARPAPVVVGQRLIWNLGRVEPGKEIRIDLVVQPDEGAIVDPLELADFHASYQQSLHFQTPLVRPKLSMKMKCPESLNLGEWGTIQANVKNSGNWPVRNAILRAILPAGLKPADPNATIDIGLLVPTQSKTVEFRVRAVSDGPQVASFELLGSEGASARAEARLQVVSPRLTMDFNVPAKPAQGAEGVFRIDVANTGRAPTAQLQVDLEYSRHWEPVTVEGATLDPLRRVVSWTRDDLAAEGSLRLESVFRAVETGVATVVARVRTASGVTAEDRRESAIDFAEQATSAILEEFLSVAETPAEAAPPTAETPVETMPHIVFCLGEHDFAVPMDMVLEVGKPPRVTPLPNVPAWLLGVANIRGEVVSLVEPSAFLAVNCRNGAIDRRIIVVRTRDHAMRVALVVDRVRGMRALNVDRLLPPEGDAPHIRGLLQHEGRVVSVIDLENLLDSGELNPFADD